MNKGNINIIFYLVVISIILISSSIITFLIVPNYFKEFVRIINLMVWIVLFIVSVPVENNHSRFKGKNDKIKTTLIIVILYYMIYFSLGLIYGYQISPYSRNLGTLIKNIIFIIGTLLLQEYVRNKLVNSSKSFKNYVIATIVFIIINLDYNNFGANFQNGESIFRFFTSNIISGIAVSTICTYLAKTGGYFLILAYRLPVCLATILLPIFPNIDWFFTTMLDILLALILFIYINYEHTIKINRLTRKEKKKINPVKSVIQIGVILVIVIFISGLFPYKPVAVMSNSMVPDFYRGYIVISKKIKKEEIKNIKVGDILQYQLGENAILHRVISIEQEDEKLYFITKGDNNDSPDSKRVEEEQIMGIIKFKIPYLGYPSVWFSEILFKKNSLVQT